MNPENLVRTARHEDPLVSLVLLTYNQRQFVDEAVEGVLSQTYRRLQIVISDDHSTDGTFERISEAIARADEDREILLRQNSKNLGLGRHLMEVMKLVKGKFIILAAGDDISLPERVSRMVEEWRKRGCGAVSIYSGYHVIDDKGAVIGMRSNVDSRISATLAQRIDGTAPVEGPSHGFAASLYTDFGDFVDNVVNEDVVLQFRAALRDGVFTFGLPLIKYRVHCASISGYGSLRFLKSGAFAVAIEREEISRRLRCLSNFSRDLVRAADMGWRDAREVELLLGRIQKQHTYLGRRDTLLAGSPASRVMCAWALSRDGTPIHRVARDAVLGAAPRCILAFRWIRHKVLTAKELWGRSTFFRTN